MLECAPTINTSLTDSSQETQRATGSLPGLKTWHRPLSRKFGLLSTLLQRSLTDGACLLSEQTG